MKKMSPKNIKICTGCPLTGLTLDVTPKFKFVINQQTDTKRITIIDKAKNHINNKLKTLF